MIAGHLAEEPGTEEIGLADIDLVRAKEVAERIASEKVKPMRLDAGDLKALREALQGKDLVINSSLPRFNEPIMEAALELGVNYIDLAWGEPEILDRDKDFREAGLVGIVGCGEDPGISNVLARAATEDMTEVDTIRIVDAETATSDEYPFPCLFSPVTFLKEALGESVYFEDGQLKRLPAFSGEEFYDFPKPVGRVPVYYMDHEEVYTLARFLGPKVKRVEFKLALDPPALEILRAINALGLMSKKPVQVQGVPVVPRKFLLQLIPTPDELKGKVRGYAALAVEASGMTPMGKVWRRLYTYMDHQEAYEKHDATGTAYLTGTGAAVAAIMFLRGKVKDRGLMPPEMLDSEAFLSILEAKNVRVHREEREA